MYINTDSVLVKLEHLLKVVNIDGLTNCCSHWSSSKISSDHWLFFQEWTLQPQIMGIYIPHLDDGQNHSTMQDLAAEIVQDPLPDVLHLFISVLLSWEIGRLGVSFSEDQQHWVNFVKALPTLSIEGLTNMAHKDGTAYRRGAHMMWAVRSPIMGSFVPCMNVRLYSPISGCCFEPGHFFFWLNADASIHFAV